MYGNNPYLNNFGFNMPMPQQERQQPIQNIFTNTTPTTNASDFFVARFLKNNESAESEIVTQKTAFISLQNKKLDIKDIDGTITHYDIIPPKDEKDIKIEQLESELLSLKEMIANGPTTNTTNAKPTKK